MARYLVVAHETVTSPLLLDAGRWATRAKVSSLRIAGTGISVHSATGRSTVLVARG